MGAALGEHRPPAVPVLGRPGTRRGPAGGCAAVVGPLVAQGAPVHPAAVRARAAAQLEALRDPCEAGCAPGARGGPLCRLGARTRARRRAGAAIARAHPGQGPGPVAVPLEVWADHTWLYHH